ncbi:KEOPS complex subunit Pcc1 [Salarchaeum sp. JOR-1]|uniref:KEOPS complex subunit Pcc1 n=1 Tax=Salarchaeum sp. JOR-1 TaxID=2599399 RepID=UPI001198BE9A|nr:KEOPS complex subunit Pcc1 [Salarchaeum sp. JOR-1]QDX41308.1 KEOPS complex Pcc1-like subunit [Salarchaeum sp. JOR-1]
MTREATVRTRVERPDLVANAVRPDNTAQMQTEVRDESVVTHIERPSVGGLRTTLDDYTVNVTVAAEVAQHAHRFNTTQQ